MQSKIFFIWFACCFLCISFVYFFIYETKGWSLEDVDQLYNDVSSARKSAAWTPQTTFTQRLSVANQGGVVGKDHNGVPHSDEFEHQEKQEI